MLSLSRYLNSWSMRSGVQSLKSSLYTWQAMIFHVITHLQQQRGSDQHAVDLTQLVSLVLTGRPFCQAAAMTRLIRLHDQLRCKSDLMKHHLPAKMDLKHVAILSASSKG